MALETTNRLPVAPHSTTVKQLTETLDVSVTDGLSFKEIAQRRRRFGRNVLQQHQPASIFKILINQLRSPVVYLLSAATLLAVIFGEWLESVAIVAVLIINTVIGFVTEWRAKRSMEALQRLSRHNVRVRRDQKPMVISAEKLVPGDIVILDAGDMIAADMRVVSSANMSCDESALTGESLPVAKSAEPVDVDTLLAERTSMLYKGCAVTRGTGEGLVIGTGMYSELGRVTDLVEKSQPQRSPLEHQLERLSRHLIWLTIGIVLIVGLAGVYSGQNIALMIETGVALAIAAIPEGLPIVATLALARGMQRMARRNALIERLSAVETLGATTVIMTDKTGTITENRMYVDRIITPLGEMTFDRQAGNFLLDGRKIAIGPDNGLDKLLREAALCSNAELHENGHGGTGDPMEIALLEAAFAGGLSRKNLQTQYPELAEHAFDATTRMMATIHQADDDQHNGSEFFVAVKGAPEAVFEKLSNVQITDGVLAFDAEQERQWKSNCDLLAGQGLRLLAVAGKSVSTADEPPYSNLTLYGLIGLQDPPRADVAAALADARKAGIKVVMVTGDHARTAKSVSEAIGLAPDTVKVIEGGDLKPFDQIHGEEKDTLREAVVFSRVTPEQKLDLIALHQQAGEIVAMTGDGINDAPALKKAEIGIAMGQRGTQVAREASEMILRDDAFSTIIHAIREGRIIYTNIRRFTTYLLSCNLSEILVIGLAILSGLPLPLLPLQILFLNLVTDVFPAFALGTIKSDRNVLIRPPRPPSESILGKAQWQAIIIHGIVIALVTLAAAGIAVFMLELLDDQITTMCFFTLALAQLWHVFNMRNWREGPFFNPLTQNTYVWLAIAICIALLTLAAFEPHLVAVLKIAPLPISAWGCVLGLSTVPVLLREIGAMIARRV